MISRLRDDPKFRELLEKAPRKPGTFAIGNHRIKSVQRAWITEWSSKYLNFHSLAQTSNSSSRFIRSMDVIQNRNAHRFTS